MTISLRFPYPCNRYFHIDIGHRIIAFDIDQSAQQNQYHNAKRNSQYKKAFMQPETLTETFFSFLFFRCRRSFLFCFQTKTSEPEISEFLFSRTFVCGLLFFFCIFFAIFFIRTSLPYSFTGMLLATLSTIPISASCSSTAEPP